MSDPRVFVWTCTCGHRIPLGPTAQDNADVLHGHVSGDRTRTHHVHRIDWGTTPVLVPAEKEEEEK